MDKIGKVTVVAKGAKKSKNKFFSSTLPLCYGEYMVFKGKNLYTLNEGRIIQSFQELLNELETLTYASYACELIDIGLIDEESNIELFKSLVTVLYLLKTKAVDDEVLIRAFELKVLKLTGYSLNFDACSICRKSITTSNYINLQYYGGVCDECVKASGITISRAAYNALKFLNNVPMDKVYRLNISSEVKKEIYKVTSNLISNGYSKKPKSLQMLEYIKE
jgi:DNA repair protein RecO (recombination protein O)